MIVGMMSIVSSTFLITNSLKINLDGDISLKVELSTTQIPKINFPIVLPSPKIAGKIVYIVI
jgi:hypothetical protein